MKEYLYAYDNKNNLKGCIYKVEENNYLYENNGLNVYSNDIENLKEIGKYDGVKFLPFKILK